MKKIKFNSPKDLIKEAKIGDIIYFKDKFNLNSGGGIIFSGAEDMGKSYNQTVYFFKKVFIIKGKNQKNKFAKFNITLNQIENFYLIKSPKQTNLHPET